MGFHAKQSENTAWLSQQWWEAGLQNTSVKKAGGILQREEPVYGCCAGTDDRLWEMGSACRPWLTWGRESSSWLLRCGNRGMGAVLLHSFVESSCFHSPGCRSFTLSYCIQGISWYVTVSAVFAGNSSSKNTWVYWRYSAFIAFRFNMMLLVCLTWTSKIKHTKAKDFSHFIRPKIATNFTPVCVLLVWKECEIWIILNFCEVKNVFRGGRKYAGCHTFLQ